MAQFMLLLQEDPTGLADVSAQDIQAIIGEYVAWRTSLAERGHLVAGNKLKDEGGKHMTASEDGVRVVDGPYAEAKDVIGGYFLIEASDYDEAVALCTDCPHLKYGERIEVREIDLID